MARTPKPYTEAILPEELIDTGYIDSMPKGAVGYVHPDALVVKRNDGCKCALRGDYPVYAKPMRGAGAIMKIFRPSNDGFIVYATETGRRWRPSLCQSEREYRQLMIVSKII